MRCISFVMFLLLAACDKQQIDPIQAHPGYRIIKEFAGEIPPKMGLRLSAYAVNHSLPKGYQYTNRFANFDMSYVIRKNHYDTVSLEEARSLVVSIVENFLQKVNVDAEIIPLLERHPLVSDLVHITLHFRDENSIELGTGIATVYFSKGKIKYQRYEIYEYTGRYPASGKHFYVHEESYEEALALVKQQGTMVKLTDD